MVNPLSAIMSRLVNISKSGALMRTLRADGESSLRPADIKIIFKFYVAPYAIRHGLEINWDHQATAGDEYTRLPREIIRLVDKSSMGEHGFIEYALAVSAWQHKQWFACYGEPPVYCEDYDGFRNFLCYVVYGSFWGIM